MSKTICWALFLANPSSNPPFSIKLGVATTQSEMPAPAQETFLLEECEHIPHGIQRIHEFCQKNELSFSPNFTLLYPIYMGAMNTDDEMTMHNIAWLIKDEADAKSWKFDRIGGLTNRRESDFYTL